MDSQFERACREVMRACACEGLRRSARSVTTLYQEALAGSGVRVAQLPILVAAALMGPAPVTAMADTLIIDRTTLTRNLASLERGGLVAFEDDEDARLRLVVLTSAGRQALGEALAAWQPVQDRVADAFGADRLAALVAELAAFTAATRS
jgi:DNA-binding MarR family transcriptional regulator